MAISLEKPAQGEVRSPSLDASLNRIIITLITMLGTALRLWQLGRLGLSYDEAATALMARATPAEIVFFHWTAGFEHPPFWQLLVFGWSQVAGQSEFALRTLPALSGILVIPLVWQFARYLYPETAPLWHGSALLTAMAPVLIYYSQEARMYAIVLALALSAMIVSTRLVRRPTWSGVFLLILLNVVMTGFHYYAALLFAAQGIYFLIAATTEPAFRAQWPKWSTALALSALPLLLWMTFSPGFQMTLESVLSNADTGGTPLAAFADELWRDLTVAAIRWQPDWTRIGYLWLPLLAVGLLDALWLRREQWLVKALGLVSAAIVDGSSVVQRPGLRSAFDALRALYQPGALHSDGHGHCPHVALGPGAWHHRDVGICRHLPRGAGLLPDRLCQK